MDETSPAPGSAPLNGWKEIASYLGRSVRAAQRWERELGLPVHRIRTQDGQTVYAFRNEIDDWRRRLDTAPASEQAAVDDSPASNVPPAVHVIEAASHARPVKRTRMWISIGLLTVALIAALAAPRFIRADALPVTTHFVGRTLEVRDADKNVVWIHPFDRDVGTPSRLHHPALQAIVDLDGDGSVEVVKPVRFEPQRAGLASTDAVYAFSVDGDVRWIAPPPTRIVCGADLHEGPWQLLDMTVSTASTQRRVWLSYAHPTWRHSFVLEIAPDGGSIVRYVQSGWIFSLAEWSTPAGTMLAAAGTLNETGLPSVALIDLAGKPSRSPATNTRDICSDSAPDAVHRILMFPVAETVLAGYDYLQFVRVIGSSLKMTYSGSQAILEMTPDFRLREFALPDAFAVTHRERETEQKLSHPLQRCPFVTSDKEVREWTPSGGWTNYTIKPLRR